jgi:hypothetical protein
MVSGSTEEAVELEDELMKAVREMADYVIDTTFMQPAQLKERVTTLFSGDIHDSLLVTFVSFGFKYGISWYSDLSRSSETLSDADSTFILSFPARDAMHMASMPVCLAMSRCSRNRCLNCRVRRPCGESATSTADPIASSTLR